MSITWKLLLSYLLVVLVAVGSLGLYLNHEIDRHYVSSLEEGLRAQAALIRDELGPGLADAAYVATSRRIVSQAAASAGARVTLIAADGKVLADSEHDPTTMENHASRPEVREALATGRASSIRHSTTIGVDMLYVAVPARAEGRTLGVVRVAIPLRAVAAAEARVRARLIVAAAGAGLLSVLISLWFTKRSLSSIRRLRRAAAGLARGDLEAHVSARGRDEIASLAGTFNEMASRIRTTVRELREQRQQIETVFARMAEAIIVTDAEGRITLCNPAFERVFGLACEKAHGLGVAEATKSSPLDEAFRAALRGEQTTVEVRVLFPAPRTLEATVTGIADGAPLGAVAVLHDVTQLRRLEAVRREFVANASHELQTPITAIKAMAETLLAGGREDPALAERFLHDLERQADRLGALVRDLLDLTTIEAGAHGHAAAEVEVAEVVSASADQLRALAEQRQVTVELDVPGDLRVSCDRSALNRILANLLDNAMKYTEPGGRVGVAAVRSGDEVAITVWDTGIGIPSTDLERIFERFYRVDKGRSRALGGTGLGLSIVKHLAEAMGGRVSVESELGRGSRFTVTLVGSGGQGSRSRETASAGAQRKRVLFLCTGNSARSQMAEGFARHYGGGRLEAFSAGTAPRPVRAEAVEVMREVGVDISGQRSKGLEDVPQEVDVVVTVCDRAAEACPIFPGSPRMEHWSLPDPAEAQGTPEEVMATYRSVRDEVAERVRALVGELTRRP